MEDSLESNTRWVILNEETRAHELKQDCSECSKWPKGKAPGRVLQRSHRLPEGKAGLAKLVQAIGQINHLYLYHSNLNLLNPHVTGGNVCQCPQHPFFPCFTVRGLAILSWANHSECRIYFWPSIVGRFAHILVPTFWTINKRRSPWQLLEAPLKRPLSYILCLLPPLSFSSILLLCFLRCRGKVTGALANILDHEENGHSLKMAEG